MSARAAEQPDAADERRGENGRRSQLIWVFARHEREGVMRKRQTAIGWSACFGGLFGALLALSCNGFVGEWIILDSFGASLAKVESGNTRDQVVSLLGQPTRESDVFELPQRDGYERLFQEAQESHSVRFLYWNTGVDEVAVVGLTSEDKVAFKCRAGT